MRNLIIEHQIMAALDRTQEVIVIDDINVPITRPLLKEIKLHPIEQSIVLDCPDAPKISKHHNKKYFNITAKKRHRQLRRISKRKNRVK